MRFFLIPQRRRYLETVWKGLVGILIEQTQNERINLDLKELFKLQSACWHLKYYLKAKISYFLAKFRSLSLKSAFWSSKFTKTFWIRTAKNFLCYKTFQKYTQRQLEKKFSSHLIFFPAFLIQRLIFPDPQSTRFNSIEFYQRELQHKCKKPTNCCLIKIETSVEKKN